MSPPNGIDLNHPDVALYLKLVRLQVLTPLAVLINFATCLVCAVLVHPSLAEVSKQHATSITPSPIVIAMYWGVVFAAQIGFCLLLVFARAEQTKRTLVSLGLSIVLANWIMAAWAVTWTLQLFLASTVLLGLQLILLLYANIRLLFRASTASILELVFIHTPVTLFFVVLFMLDFWQSLFIELGHTWDPLEEQGKQRWELEGLTVLVSTGVVGLLVVVARSDIVWTIGACGTLLAIIFGANRGVPVLVTGIVLLVLFPVALFVGLLWRMSRRQGAIALPPDDEQTHPHEHHQNAAAAGPPPANADIPIHNSQPPAYGEPTHQQQPYQHSNIPHHDTPVEESVWG